MFPVQAVTVDIKWTPEDLEKAVEAGTHTARGTPLGVIDSISPPFEKIMGRQWSSSPKDTYVESVGQTIKSALEREYPEIVSAHIEITCSVRVQKGES